MATLSDNDLGLVREAIRLECDMGIKTEIHEGNRLYSRASLRWNRPCEPLGTIDNVEAFRAKFRDLWYAGSA